MSERRQYDQRRFSQRQVHGALRRSLSQGKTCRPPKGWRMPCDPRPIVPFDKPAEAQAPDANGGKHG